MTDTTQPDPQVVAWMQRHLRDNPGASTVDLMRGYRNADSSVRLRELHAAAEAVLYPRWAPASEAVLDPPPLTLADIPAGQGPASLFIAPADVLGYTDGNAALWIQTEDGPLFIRWASKSGDSEANRALWDHLTATLPTVTAEEGA